MSANRTACHIGLLIFPGMTQIDFAEPFEVFARLPDTIVHVVAKTLDPVRTDRGLVLVPTVTCEDCPLLDVIVVPGGPGTQHLLRDDAMLGFLRQQAQQAKYVTSVCTGALVLGAAGMDFALQLAAMLRGETIAQQIQLHLEYSPAPPFQSGSPATAPKDVVETVRRAAQSRQQERWKAASDWRNNRLAQRGSLPRGPAEAVNAAP